MRKLRPWEKDSKEALARFAAKWIVDQALAAEWCTEQIHNIRYQRKTTKHTYDIRKLAMVFSRGEVPDHALPTKNIPTLPWHVKGLSLAVGGRPTVDYNDLLSKQRQEKPQFISKIQGDLERFTGQVIKASDGQ